MLNRVSRISELTMIPDLCCIFFSHILNCTFTDFRANTFSINEGVIYCTTHFKQLFARKGNYDEGFGRQLYKKKWQEEQKRKQDASA